MKREVACAGIEDNDALEAVVDRRDGAARLVSQAWPGHGGGSKGLHGESNSAGLRRRRAWQCIWNPIVGCVDDAADRLRTPAQRCWAAYDLDPFRRQGIERNGVILAQLRHAA